MRYLKKSTAFVAIMFVVNISWAQTSVYGCLPTPVPNTSITAPPPIEVDNCHNFTAGYYSHPTGATKEFRAYNKIKVTPEFKMGSSTTSGGKFTLKMTTSDIVWFEPTTLSAVPIYEKLELGVDLLDDIQDKIDAFIVDEDDPNGINPFLEWEIDVQAVFTHTSSGAVRNVDGFFFEEFTRNIQPYILTEMEPFDYNTWGGTWEKNEYNQYPFRIRFAPPELGVWECDITVTTNTGTYTYPSFHFNVIPSGNLGYVRVGDNNRFFARGNSTFMPIGPNFAWPRTYAQLNPSDHAILQDSIIGKEQHQNVTAPLQTFLNYEGNLLDLASKGANSFRYIMCPWSGDIEFEKLGNYYDRLHIASEIDKMVGLCETNDLTIYFNMSVHYPLESNPFGIRHWDWSAGNEYYNERIYDPLTGCYTYVPYFHSDDTPYCYHINDEFTLDKPEEFLTHEDAQKYYEQRLRYIVSRWGYSTAIGMWELFSEANQIGAMHTNGGDNKKYREYPYKDEAISNNMDCVDFNNNIYTASEMRLNVMAWHSRMSDYIKNILDDPHPISASYAGRSRLPDLTHNLSNIDYVSENRYNNGEGNETGGYLNWFHGMIGPTGLLTNLEGHGKPVVFPENGINNISGCDIDRLELLRTTWMNAFSGLAMGMDWSAWTTPNEWYYYGDLLTFLDNNKFDQESWRPGQRVYTGISDWTDMARVDKLADMTYLVKGNKTKVMGVISNRSYNYYSSTPTPFPPGPFGTPCEYLWSNESDLDDLTEGPYQNWVPVNPGVGPNTLKVNDLAPLAFQIDYYHLDAPTVVENTQIASGPSITLEYPTLTDIDPLIAFKIYPLGGKSMSISTNISASVYPNPTQDIVTIKWGKEIGAVEINITDVTGKEVLKTTPTKNQYRWDSRSVESGMYFVNIIRNGKSLFSERVVVQK
jgi:hypothetical protein